MDAQTYQRLLALFESFPELKLAYFFGPRNLGTEGPLSDYDFAVYTDERDTLRMHDLRLRLMSRLCQVLKSDRVDLVKIAAAVSPELKYQGICTGTLLFAWDPFMVIVEPQVLNEYFDRRDLLRPHRGLKYAP